MRTFLIGLLGLASATFLTIPKAAQAQTFDFDRLEFIQSRPRPANGSLFFFGDQNQNEGYAAFSNLDRNAPDAGHIGFRSDLNNRYYATGRENSPDPTGATRSATLKSTTNFPTLINYLNDNGIPLSDIGYGFGQKPGFSVTQSLNLGADVLGQDWFGRPGSPVEELIYRARPESFERYLTYQTTKIIVFGYSDTFFASADDNPDSIFGNPNIFFSNPVSPSKVSGLDGLEAGIADAFLKDVAAGGGKVYDFSEDILDPEDLAASVNGEFEIYTFSFPLEIRVVREVPESSPVVGLILLLGGGVVTQIKRHKRSVQ